MIKINKTKSKTKRKINPVFLMVLMFLSIATLLFFPEPETNFMWYVVVVIVLLTINFKIIYLYGRQNR